MLEKYFKLPAILRRHQGGLLGPHLDSFVSMVGSLGYPRQTVRRQCCILRDLGLWLESQGLGVPDLEDGLIGRHLEERRQSGKTWRGDEAATIRRFVEHLRESSVICPPVSIHEESPLEHILGRYTKYLLMERAVVEVTVDYYVPFVHRFLAQRFGEGPFRLRDLTESDVTDFVLRWAHSQSPGRAKLLVTALRSFLRFLLEHGEIEIDLAVTVPTVANWRLSAVPKYMSPEEVERLLDACDRNTAVGQRDHAILLLLARLGLRGCEVARLEIDDIDWRAGEFTVRGKGLAHDRLPLLPEVGEALAVYLRQCRPTCSTRRVFVRSRAPFCAINEKGTVGTVVRNAIRRAGLETPAKGAHLLRHSLATGMLRAGASMAEIGAVLRHRSPITTEIYAKVDFDVLRRLAQPWPIAGGGR